MMQTQTASIFVPMLLGHRFPVPVGVVRHIFSFPREKPPKKRIRHRKVSADMVAAELLRKDGVGAKAIYKALSKGNCPSGTRIIINRFVAMGYARYSNPEHKQPGPCGKERDVFVIDREALEKIARRLEK